MSTATVFRMGALAGTCQPGGDVRSAQQMCAAHGGVYFAGGDYCEVGGGGWKN